MKDKSGAKSEGVDGVYIGNRVGDDETTYTITRLKSQTNFGVEFITTLAGDSLWKFLSGNSA